MLSVTELELFKTVTSCQLHKFNSVQTQVCFFLLYNAVSKYSNPLGAIEIILDAFCHIFWLTFDILYIFYIIKCDIYYILFL